MLRPLEILSRQRGDVYEISCKDENEIISMYLHLDHYSFLLHLWGPFTGHLKYTFQGFTNAKV